MAVDIAEVAKLDVEPGTLPEKMAAWVIRAEREGEPKDAFQVEEVEVPEPAAFEVIVRVMAAGVNFNNVWASLGKPVSVFGYGDHPEYGHHIGGSDASGIVWTVVTGFFGQNFGYLVDHIDSREKFLFLGVGGLVIPTVILLTLFWVKRHDWF